MEFVLDEPNFSMPVGRINFLHLGPMNFEEFLQALGENKLLNYLKNYTLENDISDVIHTRLTELVKIFCIVGGMPEVVNTYAKTTSIKKLNQIKNDIVTAFHLDFGKYKSKTNSRLLSTVFYKLPQLIGKKIKYVALSREQRAKELSAILEQLCLAKICYKIYHSHSNGIPLKADVNENNFKVLFLDVGLVQAIMGINALDFESSHDLNLVNKGIIAEQFIGQHLLYLHELNQEPGLHYWMREKKSSSAEVDYIVSYTNQIIPVEVKSGKTGTMRSLHLFVQEKNARLAVRFNADKPSLLKEQRQTAHGEFDFRLLSLPHYLVGQLHRFIQA